MSYISFKGYFYHISDKPLGKKPIFIPCIPRFSNCMELDFIKRISVSPSPEQCCIALPLQRNKKYYLYRTDREIIPKTACFIWDAHKTCEHWILQKTKMIFVCSFVCPINNTPDRGNKQWRKNIKIFRKLLENYRDHTSHYLKGWK